MPDLSEEFDPFYFNERITYHPSSGGIWRPDEPTQLSGQTDKGFGTLRVSHPNWPIRPPRDPLADASRPRRSIEETFDDDPTGPIERSIPVSARRSTGLTGGRADRWDTAVYTFDALSEIPNLEPAIPQPFSDAGRAVQQYSMQHPDVRTTQPDDATSDHDPMSVSSSYNWPTIPDPGTPPELQFYVTHYIDPPRMGTVTRTPGMEDVDWNPSPPVSGVAAAGGPSGSLTGGSASISMRADDVAQAGYMLQSHQFWLDEIEEYNKRRRHIEGGLNPQRD